MARLKVKQISDFASKVNELITTATVDEGNSIDNSQESLGSVSDALSVEIAATNGEITALQGQTASAATDAELGVVDGRVDDVSGALVAEIAATNGEITALQAQTASAATDGELGAISTALSAEIVQTDSDITAILGHIGSAVSSSEMNDEVVSIDLRVSNTEDDTTAVSNAVSAILAGSDVDLDQFAEVIAYVDSLDTADGGALTTALGSIDTAISVGASVDAAVSGALVAEISATASDVLSIETVLGTMGTSETITNISNGLSSEIATTNTEVTAINNSIDALQAQTLSAATDAELGAVSDALSVEIAATNSDVIAINNSIDALQAQTLSAATDAELGAVSDALSVEIAATNGEIAVLQAQNAYVHQMGTFASLNTFTVRDAMNPAGDFLVFVNGHNIHKLSEGEAADGWATGNGLSITLNNIGYDLEADDHIYVTGNLA